MLAFEAGVRMRSLISLVLMVSIPSTAVAAKPREVRRLQPSSQWVVDYANESCSLGRSFGDGDRNVTVFFDQFEPGDTFNLTLIGKPLDSRDGWPTVTVQFGPDGEQAEAVAVGATNNNKPAIILQGGQRVVPLTKAEKAARKKAANDSLPFEPAPIAPAREKAATWLRLGNLSSFDFVFETGPMDAPLDALRTCSWDMVKSWGLDVEQQKHLSTKARPTEPPVKWFSADDYPTKMLRGGYQAIVNFRLLIDETGKATACKIQVSTRPKEFDDVVCAKVMKRARFHPAVDAQGKPVRSFWRQTVNFRLSM